MTEKISPKLVWPTLRAVKEAGESILDIYQRDFAVDYKDDNSPLTEADRRSHAIISQVLQETNIPIFSEEGKDIAYSERKNWRRLWLVDPLDGTKEFVKKNGEFTVNIALVEDNQPVFGVVYAPVLGTLFFGGHGFGAYKLENLSDRSLEDFAQVLAKAKKLKAITSWPKSRLRVVASRSHRSVEVDEYIEKLKQRYEVELVSKGSSLKLCLIATGEADFYPRLSPTKEWDIAAGHAIVNETGQGVFHYQSGKALRYNKENVLNDWFYAGLGNPLAS